MAMTRTFLLLITVTAPSACGSMSPATPDRFGIPAVLVYCDQATGTALKCRAPVLCVDIYPCQGVLPDVTATATWSVDDPSVAQVVAPGTLVGVGVGNTVVRAQSTSFGSGSRQIAVFAGTMPLPTFSIEG